jgi:integrase
LIIFSLPYHFLISHDDFSNRPQLLSLRNRPRTISIDQWALPRQRQAVLTDAVRYRRERRILEGEVAAPLASAPGPGLKDRAALGISSGAGLRAPEVCNLKVSNIVPEARLRHDNSQRVLIHGDHGKRARDRQAMLAPSLQWVVRR